MNIFKDILFCICKDNDISIKSFSDDWLYVLEKNNKIHYILGYKFDINDSAISQILDDKCAFYELVKYKNYNIIEYNIIFKEYNKEYIEELFNKYNKDVVVKPNNGTCGNSVYHIKDLDLLYTNINELLERNYSLCLSPYVDIKSEYRVIMFNGNVEFVYKKIRPIVYGDGKHTLKELLLEFNYSYFSNVNDIDDVILDNKEMYVYSWKHNLSQGANISLDIDSNILDKLNSIAKSLVKDINIKFCSIDIIEDNEGKLFIIEANSGVMMNMLMKILPDGKKIARGIYAKAIKCMFEEE